MKHLFCFLVFLNMEYSFGQTSKHVTICWDVSHSMQDRDLNKEFYFLDSYFRTKQNAAVTLLAFSNEIASKDDFTVTDGNWSTIKDKLEGFTHDGATSFELLGDYAKGDVLLFTDGRQNTDSSTPNFEGEVFIVNSKKNFDRATLNLLTIVNNGNLVNLALDKNLKSKTGAKAYTGTIYRGTTAMSMVDVYIKGSQNEGVKTDEKGNYTINATEGDTLVVSFGKMNRELLLGEGQGLDFLFDEEGIQLNEVVLIGEKVEQGVSEEIITGFGKENKDKIGYAVQSIGEEEVPDAATTGNTAIQGKFSGVSLGQNEDLSQVKMRPSNSVLGNNYGLIVIDGVPMEQSNSFTGEVANTGFVDPQNIADITVLKGLAATNRYGSIGSNGVLMITTKTAIIDAPRGKKKDLARLTNNIYDGKLKVNNKTLVTPYLKELKKGKNLQEAYDLYLDQRLNYWDTPEYLVDVSSFFYASQPELGNRILSNILEKEKPSYEELRAMYLKSRENGNQEMTLLAANKMLEDFPNKIQSYLDVAIAQKNNGDLQNALDVLNGIVQGTANPSLNFTGLEKVAGTETRNLVNQQRSSLDIGKVDSKYRNNLTYNARIVLEWSSPDAEFVVQFVNPQKRFFNWEHTDTVDKKRILDELQHGFSSEQFEIVGSETIGDWILNVTYLGNRTQENKVPTFLKCTIQYNFGKPEQSSQDFLVRLTEVGEEQQLAKFTVE